MSNSPTQSNPDLNRPNFCLKTTRSYYKNKMCGVSTVIVKTQHTRTVDLVTNRNNVKKNHKLSECTICIDINKFIERFSTYKIIN